MGFVEDFCPKVNEYTRAQENLFCTQEHKRTYFALEAKIIPCPFTSVSHILTVTNYQVCSNM